jgi:hypothetical protein
MNAQIPIFDIDTHSTEPPDLRTSRAPTHDLMSRAGTYAIEAMGNGPRRFFDEMRAARFGIQLVSIASPDGRKLTSREYAIQAVTELDADERGNSKR